MPTARSALLGLRSSAIAIAIETDIETDAANHRHGALLPRLCALPVPGLLAHYNGGDCGARTPTLHAAANVQYRARPLHCTLRTPRPDPQRSHA
ncbi:hypothetical protein FHR60_002816 [Xanthomonas arboricola]|uniref:Uncharacterized protein n=1 Tax=Xanthomonas cannabis TaxID=1885674 RepID=A0ABR6JP01_9XANT|nr:hypothetical protein [Xanthomonas cannabis]